MAEKPSDDHSGHSEAKRPRRTAGHDQASGSKEASAALKSARIKKPKPVPAAQKPR